MPFTAINPATGETLSSHPAISLEETLAMARRAHAAHLEWRETSHARRRESLEILGGLLRERKEEYARLMTAEMGKPFAQALAEAEKCAWATDYYAENAERFLAPVPAETDASRSYWTYRPLGVVLGIMPWNYPFWQVIRFATPAMAAGNAALLKHAPSVPGCALALEQLYHDAGFPRDLFRNLFADTDAVGGLIADPAVKALALTGSVRAGKVVAARAGEALKKCVLELGGSDPSVVLADADLDQAVRACVAGRLSNTGQDCNAVKRAIVVEDVLEEFTGKFITLMRGMVMGDPMDPASFIGPMARVDLRDALHDQVVRSVAAGAKLALGGTVPERPGAWYPPTVLTGVRPGMAAYEEELFGPVAVIIAAKDTADAIRIANDTCFGLGASVYTRDTALGERIAAELLDAGMCFVNAVVKSDPRLPFGGIKESGYGRELSPLGILEFTNAKTVWVK
jgi:succinate-semialdehyde dehydrogenase / glutarate-semialdehyde dehydrogenase